MKFRTRFLGVKAGRPIVFIHKSDSDRLNIHVGDRLEISYKGKKIIAVTDILDTINKNEVSMSEEIMRFLNVKNRDYVEINVTSEPRSIPLISKKLRGRRLTREEIFTIITDIVNNALTEGEIAYFVSGVYQNGMNKKETLYLTEAIFRTGISLTWRDDIVVDKHSIGGIPGNRTTPIVVSICASAGLMMPKTSSRAITSAAGTADVLELVTKVDLTPKELKEVVRKTGACLAWGGSLGLAPADDKLIRVERMLNLDPESQLIASILAKKLAVGSKFVLIDIPYGESAKVSLKKAKKLKDKFTSIGKYFNLKVKVVLTDGSRPIGKGIGPVLEMKDIFRVLEQKDSPRDLEEKSIFLAANIFEMVGKCSLSEGKKLAKDILSSGRALDKFKEIIFAQGKKNKKLEVGRYSKAIIAEKSGIISKFDNRRLNEIARVLGCPLDKGSGIYLNKSLKDPVKKGETILTIYSESPLKLKESLYHLSNSKPYTLY